MPCTLAGDRAAFARKYGIEEEDFCCCEYGARQARAPPQARAAVPPPVHHLRCALPPFLRSAAIIKMRVCMLCALCQTRNALLAFRAQGVVPLDSVQLQMVAAAAPAQLVMRAVPE